MKTKITFIIIFVAVSLGIKAQDIKGKKDNAGAVSEYNRSGLTVLILDNHNNNIRDLSQASAGIIIPDKFDNNLLSQRTIKSTENTSESIRNAIINQKVPNEIISKLFLRSKDGRFNVDRIHKRGLYNATDDDLKIASSSKKGISMLKDAGEKLLANSYIMILEIKNIQDVSKSNAKKNGYTADIVANIYRLNFNDSILNLFYNELWISEDDDQATIAKKKAKFDSMEFPVDFVLTVKGNGNGSQWNQGELLAPPSQLTKDEIFQKMINTGLSSSLYQVERKIEDFKLKAPLYSTKPLKSKVGAKEGLKSDYRFFAIDLKQNSKGETKAVRKGVVRVKKVADNKKVVTADSKIYSTFYQVAGGHLEPGMILQQRNDLGFGISGGWALGNIGGAYIKGEANLSVMAGRYAGLNLGISQLKFFASGGWQNKEYNVLSSGYNYDFSFMRWNVGLSKGWYFARYFSVAILAGYGQETAISGDFMDDIDADPDNYITTGMMDIGGYMTVNLTHWMQLIATTNFYVPLGYATDKEGETWTSYGEELNYTDFFDGRKGLSFDLGLRIEF